MAAKNKNKNKVSYVEQEEPSFLKQFKEKIGYKEGPNVNSKRQAVAYDPDADDDRPETEEDKPLVVVLKKGDLTAEEAASIQGDGESKDDQEQDVDDPGGRIMFKKPVKRPSGEDTDLVVTSSKKKKENKDISDKHKSKVKKLNNANLLSFDEEEEEED